MRYYKKCYTIEISPVWVKTCVDMLKLKQNISKFIGKIPETTFHQLKHESQIYQRIYNFVMKNSIGCVWGGEEIGGVGWWV